MHLKSWWYDLQFLKIRRWQTKIGNYGSVFALLTPPSLQKTRKIRILKKWKKCWIYHFTHVYQKPHSYEVRFLRQSNLYLSFWTIFFLFYLPNNPENQNFEKKIDAYEDAIILYICLPKITIIWWMLPEIWVQHTIFCNFGTFFALYPLLTPRIKTWKK